MYFFSILLSSSKLKFLWALTLSSVTFMSHTAFSRLLAHTPHTWYLVYIPYLVYFSLTAKGLRGRWLIGWHCNLTSRWWWFAQELILIYWVAYLHNWAASVCPYERRGEKITIISRLLGFFHIIRHNGSWLALQSVCVLCCCSHIRKPYEFKTLSRTLIRFPLSHISYEHFSSLPFAYN